MYNVRTAVLAFGFDPDSLDMPLKLAEEDATIATELAAVVDELQFQLADLGREIARRATDWDDALTPPVAIALANWRQQLDICVGLSTATLKVHHSFRFFPRAGVTIESENPQNALHHEHACIRRNLVCCINFTIRCFS